MSMSKRLMFEPEYASLRRQYTEAVVATYQHRIPAKRKNKVSAFPRWDPLWEDAIHKAAAEFGVTHRRINDGVFFEQQVDRDRVRDRAEVLWRDQHDRVETTIGNHKKAAAER